MDFDAAVIYEWRWACSDVSRAERVSLRSEAADAYLPPEVLLGEPYGNAWDMWAIGCIAAELFVKGPLFLGRDAQDQLNRIQAFAPRIPSLSFVIPAVWIDFITKLLVDDPRQRMSAAAAMDHPAIADVCSRLDRRRHHEHHCPSNPTEDLDACPAEGLASLVREQLWVEMTTRKSI